MLKGRLLVMLSSKRDQAFVKSFSGDIVQILQMAVEKHWMPSDVTTRIHFAKQRAMIEFSGKCQFRLGVEQHVNLKEENI